MTNKEKNKKRENVDDLRGYVKETIDFFPVAFCVVNPIDLIVEVNNFFEDLSGREKFSVIGADVESLFLEKEEIRDFIEDINKKQEREEKKLTFLTENNKPIPVEVFGWARKSESGKFNGYFLVIIDIAGGMEKQRELKKELREKNIKLEEKAKQMEDSRSALLNILEDVDKSYKEAEKEKTKTTAIIENLIDGMMFFNSQNELSIINPKVEEIFKIKTENVVGKTLDKLVDFSTLESLMEFIGEKGNKNKVGDLFREELKMDEDFYLEVTTTRVKKEDEILGTLVHIHDITREKRIERIKSEFVSVAAHQLRTPLSGIKWTLETFLEDSLEEGRLRGDEEDLIRKAYDANERMVHLVDDLLNVSRIEEGRYIYEPEPVNILEAINPIIENYKDVIKEKDHIEFKFNKIGNSFPKVSIDVEKIGIVLQNLLDNAIKYTNEGEITLSVSRLSDDIVKISVQDEGLGIPEEQQERLFNKFFRAENVVRKDVEGSGLGLFIAKNIIEAHEGEIGFNSTEGEGSIFYFTLPASEDADEDFIKNF